MYVERQFKITTFPMKCLMLVQDDHLILRGGGGGWQIWSGHIIILITGSARKFISRLTEVRLLVFIFNCNNFFEKAIKKGVSARVV